jgi:alkylated DNA repair protein alkB family protein 8
MNTYTNLSVPGLEYVPDIITPKEERRILKFLDERKWENDFSSRRVQQFGYIYDFFKEDLTPTEAIPNELRKVIERMEKRGIMTKEQCQQIIVNEYVGQKQGIGKHVDNDIFGDTIVGLTLGDPCVLLMHETKPQPVYDFKTLEHTGVVSGIYLEPRSLMVMKQDARYKWKHEIPKADKIQVGDKTLEKAENYRRVSVTFRSVVKLHRRAL